MKKTENPHRQFGQGLSRFHATEADMYEDCKSTGYIEGYAACLEDVVRELKERAEDINNIDVEGTKSTAWVVSVIANELEQGDTR